MRLMAKTRYNRLHWHQYQCTSSHPNQLWYSAQVHGHETRDYILPSPVALCTMRLSSYWWDVSRSGVGNIKHILNMIVHDSLFLYLAPKWKWQWLAQHSELCVVDSKTNLLESLGWVTKHRVSGLLRCMGITLSLCLYTGMVVFNL